MTLTSSSISGAVNAATAFRSLGTLTDQLRAAISHPVVRPQIAAETRHMTDARSWSPEINVYLPAMTDRDIPERVARAVALRLGREYGHQAALAGNGSLPA